MGIALIVYANVIFMILRKKYFTFQLNFEENDTFETWKCEKFPSPLTLIDRIFVEFPQIMWVFCHYSAIPEVMKRNYIDCIIIMLFDLKYYVSARLYGVYSLSCAIQSCFGIWWTICIIILIQILMRQYSKSHFCMRQITRVYYQKAASKI